MPEKLKVDDAAEAKKQQVKYSDAVGKTFSDGTITATVKSFFPKQLVKDKFCPAFMVNYNNPRVGVFVNCETFLKTFKEKDKS